MTTEAQQWAVFFGASPLGSAVVASLVVTLAVIVIVRLVLFVSPKLKTVIETVPIARKWKARSSRTRREVALMCLCVTVLLTISLLLSELMEGFVDDSSLGEWDRLFVLTAHQSIGPWEVRFFEVTTQLAGRGASLLLGFGLGLYFLLRKKRRFFTLWAGTLIGNSIIIQVIKQYFQRPRPELITPFLQEENFSFPSGHAAGSIVMFGLLAYLILLRSPSWKIRRRLTLVTAVLWLGVFVGTSRVALGVHYPTDVATGWMVAICWLTVVITIDQIVSNRPLSSWFFSRRRGGQESERPSARVTPPPSR